MPRNGRGCKQKGSNGEREVVELLRSMGYSARRIPQSGSAKDFKGDVLWGDVCTHCDGNKQVPYDVSQASGPNLVLEGECGPCKGSGTVLGSEEIIEVKRRRGFSQIYKWLEDAHALAFRGDREEWVLVLRLKDLPRR